MEGYLNLRIQPWIRRLITRLLAIIPALLTIIYFGENATDSLLVLSQVILSLQLGFATIPLIHFVSDKSTMKEFVIPGYVKLLAWLCAFIIVWVKCKARSLIRLQNGLVNGPNAITIVWFTAVPVAIGAAILLLYITFKPLISKKQLFKSKLPHPITVIEDLQKTEEKRYKKIAITIDFSNMDQSNH